MFHLSEPHPKMASEHLVDGNQLFSDSFGFVHAIRVVVVSLWPGLTEEQPTPGSRAKQHSL